MAETVITLETKSTGSYNAYEIKLRFTWKVAVLECRQAEHTIEEGVRTWSYAYRIYFEDYTPVKVEWTNVIGLWSSDFKFLYSKELSEEESRMIERLIGRILEGGHLKLIDLRDYLHKITKGYRSD